MAGPPREAGNKGLAAEIPLRDTCQCTSPGPAAEARSAPIHRPFRFRCSAGGSDCTRLGRQVVRRLGHGNPPRRSPGAPGCFTQGECQREGRESCPFDGCTCGWVSSLLGVFVDSGDSGLVWGGDDVTVVPVAVPLPSVPLSGLDPQRPPPLRRRRPPPRLRWHYGEYPSVDDTRR